MTTDTRQAGREQQIAWEILRNSPTMSVAPPWRPVWRSREADAEANGDHPANGASASARKYFARRAEEDSGGPKGPSLRKRARRMRSLQSSMPS